MRTETRPPKKVNIEMKPQPDQMTRNYMIATLVLALLAAASALIVWQMGVGGTDNWVVISLTGLSGLSFINGIIAALFLCNSKSKQT